MTPETLKPWQVPARSLVLYCPEGQWRFAIYNEVGVIDGYLDLSAEADPSEAQAALINRVEAATGLVYEATWQYDKPGWWSADLIVANPTPTRRAVRVGTSAARFAVVEIDWYDGPRSDLRSSFHLAEDSDEQLDAYIELGRVLIARRGDAIVGHLQLTSTDDETVLEIKNMAVAETERGRGVGQALIERAIATARREGVARVIVATGAGGIGNLRFYQRCGFRMLSVERDAFVPETGYPEPILIDGIELRDRVWFSWDM